jgi:hypothetical protein
VYEIESGQVFAYDPSDRAFHPITESTRAQSVAEPRFAGRQI